MTNDVYEQAKKVKNNVNNALWQLSSLESLFSQNFNVNNETFNKESINKLSEQLNNSLYYLNYTIIPTALKSGKI